MEYSTSYPKEKIAIILAVLYTAIIGLGMYITKHIFGYYYGTANMVKVLWAVEIILTALALFFTGKFYSWKEVGFGRLNSKGLVWLIFPLLTIFYIFSKFFSELPNYNNFPWGLFWLVGFTTMLVGFSEELVYRGIVLRSFLKKRPVWLAMLISAVLFSLLHSVNVFAGLPVSSMLQQLFFTFIFGLFYAAIALKINNLWPLMITHWLWDFGLFGSGMIVRLAPNFTQITYSVMAVLALVVWILVIKDKDKILLRNGENNSF